ncbi:MAG TPA: kelch repeat-containing protein [Candidatus Binataceae bacterium]|nr:kelch repeat-containing protein [Candidatus Binataceae bacterium]
MASMNGSMHRRLVQKLQTDSSRRHIRIGLIRLLIAALTVLLAGWLGAGSAVSTELSIPTLPPPDGRLHDARFGATATRLQNGAVLIAGGVALDTTASAVAELYDPVRGGFVLTGGLLTGRAYHTATLLPDGKVLIAGGVGSDGRPVRASELYDPVSGSFVPTGNLIAPRFDHTATALANGKVLISGGDVTTAIVTNIDSAELYDPATGLFSATGRVKRYYDPESNVFWKQGTMNAVRAKHSATLLRDGRVLIAGGGDASANAQASAEIYDPTTGKFTTIAPMNSPRKEQNAILLANGDVLLIGGVDAAGQVLATAELFDPSTDRFTPTIAAFPGSGANMSTGRYESSSTLLPDGRVLIAGGSDSHNILNTAELYDPSRGSFICIGGAASGGGCNQSMLTARNLASAAVLVNGEVLIAGGIGLNGMLSEAEVYNPSAGTFASVADLLKARGGTQ